MAVTRPEGVRFVAVTAMTPPSSPLYDGRIGEPSDRLTWTIDGDDLVAGRYRLRLMGPHRWEATYRGRLLGHHTHRSVALASTEHHRRETERVHRILGWAALEGVALLGAMGAASRLYSSPGAFFMLAAAAWMFLGSTARRVAGVSRSLLDPYRTREAWEPRDWYNH